MATRDLWTYSDAGVSATSAITGFDVEAVDGSIGKVDEATYDVGASYIVADTGPWIFGKKVMLPAGIIDRVDYEDERVFVNRTKDEIKDAPEFDQRYRESGYRGRLGAYYGSGGAGSREGVY
jgi:hypothetical protein